MVQKTPPVNLKVIFLSEKSKQTNKQKAYTLIQFICCCLVAGLCLPLCDHMFHSPPGSSLHGISQARILKSIDIFFSRGSS